MTKNEFGDITVLSVSDVRCIDVCEVKLEEGGKMLPLYGPNGVGKSTLIDSLSILFEGGALPPDLIRHGKKEALIEAMTDRGIIIRKRIRTKKTDGSQVTELVMTKDNQPVPAPQKALKALFGGLASPNRIAEMSGVTLYNEIVKTAGVDISPFETKISKIKQKLSDFNADLRALGKKDNPGERPEELGGLKPFNVDEYLRKTDEFNAAQDVRIEIETLDERILKGNGIIERLKQQIKEAEEKVVLLEKEKEVKAKYYAGLKEEDLAVELDVMRQSRDQAEKLKVFSEYEEWETSVMNIQANIADQEEQQKAAVKEKVDYLKSADLGVPTLSLTEDKTVLFNGNQWENTCFSDKMKAAAMLTMKGMDKEKLNLMYMEHGESLSKAKREELALACKENGVHLIMEVFVEDAAHAGTDGIILNHVAQLPPLREEKALKTVAKKLLNESKKVTPAFGKPIPAEILANNPPSKNLFEEAGDNLLGGNIDEGLDF